MDQTLIPRINVGDWVSDGIDWLTDNATWLFDAFSTVMTLLVEGFSDILLSIPVFILLAVLVLIAWFIRSWRLALGALLGFLLVMGMRQWETMLQTMSLVLVSTPVSYTHLTLPTTPYV